MVDFDILGTTDHNSISATCIDGHISKCLFGKSSTHPDITMWINTCWSFLDMITYTCTCIYIYVHTYIHTYIYTCLLLISMLWHRQAIFESKGDKLSSSAEGRIRTQGLRYLFTSRLNACWQTDWAIEDQAKNLNSTAHPYDQQAFSPLDLTASWLSYLAIFSQCWPRKHLHML